MDMMYFSPSYFSANRPPEANRKRPTTEIASARSTQALIICNLLIHIRAARGREGIVCSRRRWKRAKEVPTYVPKVPYVSLPQKIDRCTNRR